MNISEEKILETHLNPLTFQLKKKALFSYDDFWSAIDINLWSNTA